MLKTALSRAVSVAGLALGSALCAVPSAQAAVVIADFDPAYGPAIPNLGFKGTASFFVADACLVFTGVVSNDSGCSNNTMSVISAQVDFYNLVSPNTTIATINYGSNAFNVFGAFITGGVVAGVDTNISQAAPVTISELGPNPIDFSGFMSLYFFTGISDIRQPSSNLVAEGLNQPVAGIGGAGLIANCVAQNSVNCAQFSSQSNTASVTYTTTSSTSVPEPSALWLGALALGAAGLARRRAQR